MLVVADFIQLDWIHRPEFGPGWFVKLDDEAEDSDDYKFQLHYNSQSGMLSVWNEKREKIFCRVVKNVRDIPKEDVLMVCGWRYQVVKDGTLAEKLDEEISNRMIERTKKLMFGNKIYLKK